MHRGYLKLWRKVEDSGLLQIPLTYALFTFILLKATHKPRKIGTPHGVVELQRGEYMSGRIALARDLNQSEQSIRTGLDRLQKMEILTITSTSRYSIYTIVNYNNYQDDNQEATSAVPTDNQHPTNGQPTDNQHPTTKQTHKHNKNEKNVNTKALVRATRLPSDWVLPKAWGEWALTEKPSWNSEHVRKVAESFKDFWIAKSGSGASKLDWLATWRVWVRKESDVVRKDGQIAGSLAPAVHKCEHPGCNRDFNLRTSKGYRCTDHMHL